MALQSSGIESILTLDTMKSKYQPHSDDEPKILLPDGGQADASDEDEMKSILIEVPLEQYEELSETKETNGFTWRGMLLHAQRCLRREQETER
ncbi:hypothetical protein HAPAU_39520 [Halalkalicoccus paucihalophilus]|uniref:Uncharacterized protein n=1 Tax=Halalkalicoccus paucihalophilus TaxID=1008153 RepID=A0A151A8D4_9EURY|nr:hypothetical protein [Halalkalicoccus paucihalophilus]KYH23873.1 hypothetical protein HAPAU_39520 [Halalkalicoccus paucihalophilus]